jgi:hypothetical protein
MNPRLENKEDPDQMFFEFLGNSAVSSKGTSATPASGQSLPAAPSRGGRDGRSVGNARSESSIDNTPVTHRPVQTLPSRFEFNSVFAKPAAAAAAPMWSEFMTEAQVAELIERVARERRGDQVRRVRILFKPFRSTLYSFKITKAGVATVKFHLAFRRASKDVILQAAHLMLARRRSDRAAIDRKAYDAFVRALPPTEFELPGARKGRRLAHSGPGVVYSLEESFERVNREYFQSQLEQPELCWSPVRARRVLGSYQERNDRLIISRLFDSPRVPQYVLDYLMFHELLHKFLGIGSRSDGKRCMHGPEFREIEQRYRYFKQATAFLETL